MRNVLISAVIAASLAAPSPAFAAGGPKSLTFCDIAEWLGVVWVRECEGGV